MNDPTQPSLEEAQPSLEEAQPSLEEVQRALEDVRRIRGLLDSSRHSHLLRRIFRPALLFGLVSGPAIAIFAGLMEWVHQQAAAEVWGIPKAELLWILGGGCFLVNSVAKMVFFRVAAQREGYGLGRVIRKVYRADYLRLFVPMALFSAISCVAVARLGAPEQMAGILTMTLGAMWVMLPLVLPLPESPVVGWFLLLGGALSMFVLPGLPFLKIAVLWGVGISVLMPLGHWVSGDPARSASALPGVEPGATPSSDQE